MYRIRFHGRGGQGMKTASRILGTAFFFEGFEVQDAPRYGAERRGAPIFAYVRAEKKPINERGIIAHPDLVVVADDTLLPVPAAGVLQGVTEHCVLLVSTTESAETWRQRLAFAGPLLTVPAEAVEDALERRYVGVKCAGAAAALLGVITRQTLSQAIEEELSELGRGVVERNLEQALAAFEDFAAQAGLVREGAEIDAGHYVTPDWIQLPFEPARSSAPAIHAAATSVQVKTGLWRTMRPIIDYERCNRCWWVCSTFCPDGAIEVNEEGRPDIDYEHCKGCMVCVAQCPPHAIVAIPEHEAALAEQTQGSET